MDRDGFLRRNHGNHDKKGKIIEELSKMVHKKREISGVFRTGDAADCSGAWKMVGAIIGDMKKYIYLFLAFLLFGVFICPSGYCLDEPVILSDFSSFVWSAAERLVTKNNSYSTYTYHIPSGVLPAIKEYAEHLMHDEGMEQIAMSDSLDGSFQAAFRIPDSEIKGFRTQIGGKTVRGCHVLMDVRMDSDTKYDAILILYVCRGIEVHKDEARSTLIPSPVPVTPHPVTPQPTIENLSPEPTFYCAYCQNQKRFECKTCGGDGKVTKSSYVPGYNGVGTGQTFTWEEDCPIKQCVSGYIECPFCSNH